MNKETTTSHLQRSLTTDKASDSFKLDEIQWDSQYPAHPDLIPFENSAKKIIEELKQEQARAQHQSYHSQSQSQ